MGRVSGLSLRSTYLLALALLAVLSVIGHLMLVVQMRATEDHARLVAAAGQQRTLALRAAQYAHQLGEQEGDAAPERARLQRALGEMRAAHRRLSGVTGGRSTSASELESGMQRFLTVASRVARAPAATLRPGGAGYADLAFVEAQATGPLLAELEDGEGRLQGRHDALRAQLGWLSWVRLGVVLGVLAALGLLLFRPLERRLAATHTELRRERDFATRLLERLGQGVAVTDSAGRYTYVNPAYSRLLGRASGELLAREDFALALVGGAPVPAQTGEGFRSTLRRADGQEVPIWAVPVPLSDGLGTLTVITDLTERDAAEAALTRAAQYAEALLDVSRLAEADLAPEEVARRAAQIVARASEVDWGGLLVVQGTQARAVTAWHRPDLPRAFEQALARGLRRDEGLLWRALERWKPLFVDDYLAAGGAVPFAQAGLRGAAWTPLVRLPEGTFVLTAMRLHPARPWTESERELFTAAARSVSVALERRSHLRELEAAAWSDALTTLCNRRAFERDLDVALAAARRHGETFGILMIDLDGFKAVNDRFGHARGDDLLRAFGKALAEAFRTEDHTYRMGGDEFAVLLNRADPAAVQHLLDRVHQLALRMVEEGFHGTGASAGVAFYPADGASLTELVKLADERMYEHKQDQAVLRREAVCGPSSGIS